MSRRVTPPPRKSHPATCEHRWCYCYDPASHEKDGACTICRTDAFNRRMAAQADPITRHPEGMP